MTIHENAFWASIVTTMPPLLVAVVEGTEVKSEFLTITWKHT
jgi:hypothetical protein